MYTISEPTTVFGLSELRTKFKELLVALGTTKVVLALRNKPFAVLVPFERYQQLEAMADALEDQVLGKIAERRHAQKVQYVGLEAAKKRALRQTGRGRAGHQDRRATR